MANRIRFTTASQVVEAYPAIAKSFPDIPDSISPMDFIDSLVKIGRPMPATIFTGLSLPKREAVWWACMVLRGFGKTDGDAGRGLELAEAWVRNPEEEERRAAGQFAEDQYFEGPGAWIAFAAFTTSGSMAPAGLQTVPPSPEISGKAAAIAVMEGSISANAFDQIARLTAAIECAKDFAAGGDGKKVWEDLAAGKFDPKRQAAAE